MPNPRHAKAQLNVRVSQVCHELVDVIAKAYGNSKAGVVEFAVRKYAEELGLWKAPGARQEDTPKSPAGR